MASDLDQYLEGIGINMDDQEESFEIPRDQDAHPNDDLVEADAMAAGLAQPLVPTGGTVAERCESFLVNVLLNIDPAFAVEMGAVYEDEVYVDIQGGSAGKIIGRGGRTLAALEYITNTVINRDSRERVHVNIDVGGYKRRRDDKLRNIAKKLANKVRRTGMAVELDPMSAAERRVVHMAIADEAGVYSESTGEGADRRLAIKPED
ncbi:MAG: R3H domain-containing nucleic acid-binding protein [Deinococcota bacterium]